MRIATMDSPLSHTGMSDGCYTPGGGCSSLSTASNLDTASDLEAFSNLSLEERETALEELHGVAGDKEETPEFIKSCLSQMRKEISRFHGRKRKYWDRACFLCPTLEKNDRILLLFLRGECYNPRLAAEKLTLHYEHKAELFPVDILPRRITLDDLDEDDMQCMRNGALQMLQQKDQAGRTIVVINVSKVKRKHWKNELRYDFYQGMSMLSEEHVQKRGMVFVLLLSGDLSSMSQAFEGVRHGGHILAGFAIRRVGSPDVDNLDDFANLSLEQRETALEELHGVARDPDESPKLVEQLLVEMRDELAKIHARKRKSWDRACFLCPALEHDNRHFLLFLGGERFNPKEAAEKLVLHYEHKAELFSVEKLPRPITLDDLDEDDMACMRNGTYQPLKQRDQAGRTINLLNFSNVKCKHWKNEVMASLEDEATQTKGIVDVLQLSGDKTFSSQGFEVIRGGGHMFSNFSVRRVGLHYCYDDPRLRAIFYVLLSTAPNESKVRQRYHYGSRLECQYALRSFGIQVDPTLWYEDSEREATIDRYIKERRKIENEQRDCQEMESKGRILYPDSLDVLVGRGRPYQEFPGNVRLSAVIEECAGSYGKSTEKLEKTVISLQIVQKMKESGTRFLRRTSVGWEVVDDVIAREKVVQALRIRVRKERDNMGNSESLSKRQRNLE
eukprot:Nitzschia sp. Nitz4//scaffold38_size140716//56163//59474//NITZ4_003140-RA/size140716-processed-gene-0.31-mRNA-1//1//CDS//3329550057//1460//frame0